jgi:predicted nucleotide-binding protein (sugar kinase/HSP70/actin superfamily)
METMNGKKSLPIINSKSLGGEPSALRAGTEIDIDAEVAKFEEEERKRLGIDDKVEHWTDKMVGLDFKKSEKPNITLLIGGLTMIQDTLVEGALKGLGYNVEHMDCPDTEAFQTGKEYGNRAQCNPTYFTVGNLVKTLIHLRDDQKMTPEHIIKHYVFLTAGACGPCRFGMYVTEYRKALRDAGFDGFRVMLFQQTGGLKQATGEESGLEMNPAFFAGIVKGVIVGDVLNAIGYRIRPYEVEPGATDKALTQVKQNCYDALKNQKSVMLALLRSKKLLAQVKVDRTYAKPKVGIIGEFWAMTTEGDGNYQLQKFLEGEGAENDIQLVTAWLLYNIWEAKHDTMDREKLRGEDKGKYGLDGLGPWGAYKRIAAVSAAEVAVRGLFQTFAHAAGLYGYHLPDMNKVAKVSHDYYNNNLRGGEGHMEVGKLIINVVESKCHMTLSVKPFGCMPSASVSDGVQSAITEKFPGTIFCPVETSGDGRVNFYSRVQMYLFKAKQVATAELERAFVEQGITKEQMTEFLAKNPRYASPLHKAPHAYAGTSADLVAEIAPLIKMSRVERIRARILGVAKKTTEGAKNAPHVVVEMFQTVKTQAPAVASRVKEDLTLLREGWVARQQKKNGRTAADLEAAAE